MPDGYTDYTVHNDLQGAVDNVPPFSRLLVLDDIEWTGNVTINTPDLIIESSGGARRTLTGELIISASRVQLVDLDLRDDSGFPSPSVLSDDVEFLRCDISNDHTAIGAIISFSGAARAARTKFTYCRIHEIGRLPRTNHDHGIYISYSDDAEIHGCVIYNCADRGIQFYPDAQNTSVTSTIIYGCSTSVIFSGSSEFAPDESSDGNVVDGCVLSDTTDRFHAESHWGEGAEEVAPGTGNDFTNNFLWAPALDIWANGGIRDELGGFTHADNKNTAPLFADPNQGDFTPLNAEVWEALDQEMPFAPFGQDHHPDAGTLVPIEFVGYTWNGGSGFNSFPLTRPSGVEEGDVLVASWRQEGDEVITGPTSWTKVADVYQDLAAQPYRHVVFVGRDDGSPGPFEFEWDGSPHFCSGVVAAYRNARDGQSWSGVSMQATTLSSDTPTAPSITTEGNAAYLIYTHADINNWDMQPPPGFSNQGFGEVGIGGAVQELSGPSGDKTGALHDADFWTAGMLSLELPFAPSPPAPAVPTITLAPSEPLTPLVLPWRFWLANAVDLSIIGELRKAHDRTLAFDFNKSGSAGGWISMQEELSAEIVPWRTCILARRGYQDDSQTHWSGPIQQVDRSFGEGKVTFSAVGWFELLMHRLLLEIKNYNDQDAAAIIFDLLAYANAQRPTYITPGVSEVSQPRTTSYPIDTVIGQAIQGLTELESGVDWYVHPDERTLNVVARRGVDRPECKWIFIADRSDRDAPKANLRDVQETIDGTTLVNDIYARGQFSTGHADDLPGQEYYGVLFQEAASLSNVVDNDILNAYANAEIVYRQNPRHTYTISPKPSHAHNMPRFLEDFDLGDIGYLTARRDHHQIEDQAVRMAAVALAIDDLGVETITSLQTSFS